MSEIELQEIQPAPAPKIRGYYFEGFSPYRFSLYDNPDRLVVYDYDNQVENVIHLTPDQLTHFRNNVIDKSVHLNKKYDGTWLSGDSLDEALSKYNAYIEANNAKVEAALPPAEGGKRHKRSGKKRKSQKKRSGKKRSDKKSRRRH